MAEAREMRDKNRHALKWLARCAWKDCERNATMDNPEILVLAKSNYCSGRCSSAARQAEQAARKPKPVGVLAEPGLADEDMFADPGLRTSAHHHLGGGEHKCADHKPLVLITNSATDTSHPKGFAAYEPSSGIDQTLVLRIMTIFNKLHEAKALPAGPRTIMYRLKSQWPKQPDGSGYDKSDEQRITVVIKRLRQAGTLNWSWVSDASQRVYLAGGWVDADEYERSVADGFVKQLQTGQKVVLELYTEATETLPLISRISHARGTNVYSGSGCGGPTLGRDVAIRALRRGYRHGQSTIFGGLGDCDKAGYAYVMRSHWEHVAAFLYANNENNYTVVAIERDLDDPLRDPNNEKTWLVTMADQEEEKGITVEFSHIAMTPEYILEHADDLGLGGNDQGEQRERLRRYVASGTDLWDRDETILCRTIKKTSDPGRVEVELEALDPPVLRDLVIEWIETHLDMEVLARAKADEANQSFRVKTDMGVAIAMRRNGTQIRQFEAEQRRRGIGFDAA
jgi:hypothetical protein